MGDGVGGGDGGGGLVWVGPAATGGVGVDVAGVGLAIFSFTTSMKPVFSMTFSMVGRFQR